MKKLRAEQLHELKTRLIAETDSYFKDLLQERIEKVREETEIERREALEQFRIDAEDDNMLPVLSKIQGPPELTQESAPAQNGSSGIQIRLPKRREMMLTVIPEFQGEAFSQADVRTKILEKWPEADAPALASNIANLLKEMADKGQLERLGGDPIQYRENQNQEENLL